MNIEEGDDQIGIVGIDLLGMSNGGSRLTVFHECVARTGVTWRGVRATYSSSVGKLIRSSGPVKKSVTLRQGTSPGAIVLTFMCLHSVPDSTSNDAIVIQMSPAKIRLASPGQWLRQYRLLRVQNDPVTLCPSRQSCA